MLHIKVGFGWPSGFRENVAAWMDAWMHAPTPARVLYYKLPMSLWLRCANNTGNAIDRLVSKFVKSTASNQKFKELKKPKILQHYFLQIKLQFPLLKMRILIEPMHEKTNNLSSDQV